VTEEQIGIEEESTESSIPEDQDDKESLRETSISEDADVEVIEGEVDEVILDELSEAIEEEDELAALRQELETVQAQADEYLDDLRRERAAFQNYKKRQANERADLRQMAVSNLMIQILPILDDLERALEVLPEEQDDQPWVAGVELIQRKMRSTLENNGVVLVEAQPGQSFDPFIHEAVTYEENENHKEGEIIEVVQKGYKLGERTLRPAMVRVAK
jgi:molecular chaperone GrpE